MNRFYIFLLRLFLGIGISILLMRMFFPGTEMKYIILLAGVLISGSYLRERIRNKNS